MSDVEQDAMRIRSRCFWSLSATMKTHRARPQRVIASIKQRTPLLRLTSVAMATIPGHKGKSRVIMQRIRASDGGSKTRAVIMIVEDQAAGGGKQRPHQLEWFM